MADITDKVMIALELASQSVPMSREGWAKTAEVAAYVPEIKSIRTVYSTLGTLNIADRVDYDLRGNTSYWRPVRGGTGASGGNSDIFGYREPDTTPRGGKPEGSRSPEDYGDITHIAGAAGAAGGMAGGTVSAVVRSSLF